MILLWLILIPVLGGIAAWIFGKVSDAAARWVSLTAMTIELILSLLLWMGHDAEALSFGSNWLDRFQIEWVPEYGISFFLAIDGLSLLMIVLTAFIGVISVACSWSGIKERVGFYHFNLLWILGGVIGVFLALDLFLFYFFWEMMLIPMYFLIGIWGHERRTYAAIKFFIFTQASGLLMLLAILGLYFAHHAQTGIYTFNYMELLGTDIGGTLSFWLMLGFFIAFAVKLPTFPFHPWLADAHTQAPTAGSVILAGLLLKTGAYGLIRFVIPLFPEASIEFAPWAMALGVVGVLYGAVLAFGQKDLKRLVAYTSVSHLGFVLLGIFAFNEMAMQGAVMQMICHGLSTPALFIIVGTLQDHIHTRDMERMGGLWQDVPRMAAVTMFFAIASLGMPGLGNFVGEFLVLVGSFQASNVAAILASLGLVGAAVYSLWIMQRTFHGEKRETWKFPDLNVRDMAMHASMIIALIWLGLFPQTVLRTSEPVIQTVQEMVTVSAAIGVHDESTNHPTSLVVLESGRAGGEEIAR